MTVATSGASNNRRAQIAEEQVFCMQRRVEGHSIQAVAELASAHFGKHIAYGTASNRINAEIAVRVQPAAEALRNLEVAKLDEAELVVHRVMTEPVPLVSEGRIVVDEYGDPIIKPPSGPLVLGAVDRLVKIAERRARLLGLDAQPLPDAPAQVTYNIVGVNVALLT